MIIVKEVHKLNALKAFLTTKKSKVGFVPTMGALHNGHISLIEKSKKQNDVTVCSIFVNPTQFNNVEDLRKYPRTLENDIYKLENIACDILFLPLNEEMYPKGEINEQYDLGMLEHVLEGKFRPGHFQGVCMIVDKLLKAVQPTTLYLGRKDFQQCIVINKMVAAKKYYITVEICDTVREADGLAMSSRNMRLNANEKQQALKIIECLHLIKKEIKPGNINELKLTATNFLQKSGYKVDYTEIADSKTLDIVSEWDGKRNLVALVAGYLGEVRLIDNLIL